MPPERYGEGLGNASSWLSTGTARSGSEVARRVSERLQSEGAGDVGWPPEPNQQTKLRDAWKLYVRGLVGVLPTSRGPQAHLPAGGLDPAAHPEVLLGCGGHTATRTGGMRCDGSEFIRRLLKDGAHGTKGRGGWLDREPCTPRSSSRLRQFGFLMPSDLCGAVNAAGFQPPDAENRMSGGVGG